jgi:hypothetical protein
MKNELRKRRSCNGCRALEYDPRINWKCSLHYEMLDKKPLSECSKPRTIKDFVKERLRE